MNSSESRALEVHAVSPKFPTFPCIGRDDAPTIGQVLKLLPSLKKTGMGRSAFLDRQNPKSRYYDASFPKKIRLGMRSVGWSENELEAWLQSRRQA